MLNVQLGALDTALVPFALVWYGWISATAGNIGGIGPGGVGTAAAAAVPCTPEVSSGREASMISGTIKLDTFLRNSPAPSTEPGWKYHSSPRSNCQAW